KLKEAIAAAAEAASGAAPRIRSPFPEKFIAEVEALSARADSSSSAHLPRYFMERLLLDTSGYLATAGLPGVNDRLLEEVRAARQRLAAAALPVPAVESIARYGWAAQVLAGVITRPANRPVTLSDRIDRVLTHRI